MAVTNTITGGRLSAVLALGLMLAGATPTEAPVAESPVADAAQAGDVAQVRSLLQQGADANAAQSDGLTALHWAAMNDDLEIVGLLVYAGATIRPLTRVGAYTPLHLAARAGHGDVVGALLEGGADANGYTTTGVTAMHFAAQANAASAIRALALHGGDVDALDEFQGRTPLIFAASRNATVAVAALLAEGADPGIVTDLKDYTERYRVDQDERARRARIIAAESDEESPGQDGAPQALIGQAPDTSAAADPDEPEPDDPPDPDDPPEPDDPPIDEPAAVPDPDDPPIRSLSTYEQIGVQGGFAPLHYAARDGHIETARLLLDSGAELDQASGGDQSTPLLVAVINGNYDLAALLLDRGAEPNMVSDDGAGPLFATLNIEWSLRTWYPQPQMFRSQETSYLDLMKQLLDAGADPNQRTSTHIWYASYNAGRMGVDFTGASPFWRAAYATDVNAMRLLVEYGADPNIWTIKLPGRRRGSEPTPGQEPELDPSGLPVVPDGGPGIHPIHAASGVGFGTSRVAQQHRSVPDGWLPAMRYFVGELGIDPNLRDKDGFTPVHHSAARGDNETILYLVEQGADVTVISRRGQTTADMANSPEQRAQPHPATIALLEKFGSANNHNCLSCGN